MTIYKSSQYQFRACPKGFFHFWFRSPFSLACNSTIEERWWLSHYHLGSMTLRSARPTQFCLVCCVLGIGYCSQDVTSAQVTSTGGGRGIDRSLEETEVIWKELLSQEWKTGGSAVLLLWVP